MRHLVVTGHPAEHSFTMAMARAYAETLERHGHETRFRDLYRMGFDPVLPAAELSPGHAPAAAVAAAQQDILSADALAVFYPIWWMSMPAILKGYVDRVFARGFAYESRGGMVRGLLGGRKCVLVTASGAPLSRLVESGRWQAAEMLQDTHIFRAAGFDLLEHLHFDEVAPGMDGDVAERHLARVRACARQHFGGAAP